MLMIKAFMIKSFLFIHRNNFCYFAHASWKLFESQTLIKVRVKFSVKELHLSFTDVVINHVDNLCKSANIKGVILRKLQVVQKWVYINIFLPWLARTAAKRTKTLCSCQHRSTSKVYRLPCFHSFCCCSSQTRQRRRPQAHYKYTNTTIRPYILVVVN